MATIQKCMVQTILAELNGSLAWFEPITENPMLNDIEIWKAGTFTEDAHPMHLTWSLSI